MVICYSSNRNLIQILVKIPALRSVERMIISAEHVVVKWQLSASFCYFKKQEWLSKLLCAADAKGLKEKRMHSRKGEKSSDLQLQNILCIKPLLPYRHQPTAMPPGIPYHMLVWIFSTHSSFHSNQAPIYLFPSLLPLLSAFFHSESDLQSPGVSSCLSRFYNYVAESPLRKYEGYRT